MKVFLGIVFISAQLFSFQARGEQSACAKYLMKNAVIDLRVEDHNGKPKLTIFKNETLVGKVLNQVSKLFGRTLKLDELAAVISKLEKSLETDGPYFKKLSEAFGLKANLHGERLENLPQGVPLVLYANHPLSGADAFALAAEIEKSRPDLKLVAASFLESVPGFKEKAFIVSVLNTPEAKEYNKTVLGSINDHIKNKGALLIFPSGSASALENDQEIYAKDIEWKAGVIKFGLQSEDTIYKPVFVWGQPSLRYRKLRKRMPGLSNAYIFRELADQIGTTIDFTVGRSFSLTTLQKIEFEKQILFLRATLYELGKEYFKKEFPGRESIYPGLKNEAYPLLNLSEVEVLKSLSPDVLSSLSLEQ